MAPGFAIGLVVLVAISGCTRRAAPVAPPAASDTAERGPYKFTVTVTPAQLTFGDTCELEAVAVLPDDYIATLPTTADLGKLPVRDTQSPDPQPVEHGRRWRRVFVLEPEESGPLTIPALTMTYARRDPNSPAGASSAPSGASAESIGASGGSTGATATPTPIGELTTKPLAVNVSSVLAAGDDPNRPRDITGLLVPPAPRPSLLRRYGPWTAAAVAAAGLLLAGLWWWSRRQRLVPPVAPDVWALDELRKLESQGLVRAGRTREFYYAISEIVRGYVERRFTLHAPEMTTAEFLGTLTHAGGPLLSFAPQLRAFLEACDLAKYAAHEPGLDAADQALSTAREFILSSTLASPTDAPPSATQPEAQAA